MDFERVKISTTVPLDYADKVRNALGEAGAGQIGNYTFCSFSHIGQGRFMPNDRADPRIGKANKLEVVEEEHIEVVCDRAIAKQVIQVLKQAHPYEEVIVDIVPLIDEGQL
jgi:hypothetical protein